MIWHLAYLVILVYIARKAQQLVRATRGHVTPPWWIELEDIVNRIRPGTF